MKLIDIKEITGKIILKSGLHIGAGDTEMRIGGTDTPVVKHPHTNEPYIPGSSFKGKVRSLLELKSGLMGKTDGAPLGIKDLKNLTGQDREICCKIVKLFGASGADADDKIEIGTTRVSFADASLNEEWKKQALLHHLSYTEVKSENSIDRIKGTAQHPRFIERVPAETVFSFSISLKVFENDHGLEDLYFQGLILLDLDSLGGRGSRGYGRIQFEFDNPDISEKFSAINPLA